MFDSHKGRTIYEGYGSYWVFVAGGNEERDNRPRRMLVRISVGVIDIVRCTLQFSFTRDRVTGYSPMFRTFGVSISTVHYCIKSEYTFLIRSGRTPPTINVQHRMAATVASTRIVPHPDVPVPKIAGQFAPEMLRTIHKASPAPGVPRTTHRTPRQKLVTAGVILTFFDSLKERWVAGNK